MSNGTNPYTQDARPAAKGGRLTAAVLGLLAAMVVGFTLVPAPADALVATYERSWREANNNAAAGFGDTRYLDTKPDGTTYFSDSRQTTPAYSRVRVFNATGTQTKTFGQLGSGANDFGFIRGIAVGPDGHIFVGESGTTANDTIIEFSADGNTRLDTFGSGTTSATPANGSFRSVGDIDVDADGNVYVADPTADLITKFDTNGDFVTRFGGPGANPQNINNLAGIAVSPDGNVHAVDVNFTASGSNYTRDSRIVEFTSAGAYVGAWGNSAANPQAELALTRDITFDAIGYAYVTDTYAYVGAGQIPEDVVKVFSPAAHNYVMRFGSYGTGNGQWGDPQGVSVDNLGGVYVADLENRRIVKYKVAPSPPEFMAIDPEGPGTATTVRVSGIAETGVATVGIYRNSGCTGSPLATGTASEFASPGIEVPVNVSSTNTYKAKVTSSTGVVSACSTASVSYVENSPPPDAPEVTGVDPASPANNNAPKFRGTAPAGSTAILLYTDAACTSLVALGTPANFADPGITVNVADDSTTTIYAKAVRGAQSPCSTTSATYVEDSTAPAAPDVTGISPGSPNSDNSPFVKGTAAEGTTVKLFGNAECTGEPLASGPASEFPDPGIRATVGNDTTTTFHATASDAAGNASACSSTGVTYVEDSTPPEMPMFTGTLPVSPANDGSPFVKGTAEAGSSVALFTNDQCSGDPVATGSAAEFADPGIQVTVPADSSTTFHVGANDGLGNAICSTSSITYVEDSSGPVIQLTGTTPESPADDNSPLVRGTANETATVSLFANAECTGDPLATGTSAALADPGLEITVPDDSSTTIHAKGIDQLGNESCSSTSITYIEMSSPPEAPELTGSSPASPANDNSPLIRGTSAPGTTITLFDDAQCSGDPVASGSAATLADPGLEVSVADNSTTTFHAVATGPGGSSPCSDSSVTYVEQTPDPFCPVGKTGTPPNCVDPPPPPPQCPEDKTGTPPNCVDPPAGTTALSISVAKNRSVRAGKATDLVVTVRNSGDGAGSGVKVCGTVSGKARRKLRAPKCAAPGAIAPGASKKARVKVKAAKKAAGKVKVTLKLSSANGGSATATTTVKIRPAR